MSRRVAILGATGLVGRTMLAVLEQRDFPLDDVVLLASGRADARTLSFRGREVPVVPVDDAGFAGVSIALFASANEVSQRWAGPARAAGARVVDNSSAFRYDDDVPLVVPEINGHLLEDGPDLVANPNCSTIAITMALAPLERAVGIRRVWCATYQAVSGAGSEALEALEAGIRDGGAPAPDRTPFAFNAIPQIDRFEDNGYTREEMKVVRETRKILDRPDLPVSATAVRVPVRVGHSAAVNVTLGAPLAPEEARALWAAFPGVEVVDDPASLRYPTPLQAAGRDAVLVGRARRDLSQPQALEFFVCGDNLRKGAALNAVQIAERLVDAAAGSAR